MQLVAYGAQDIYLTGNPMITYFKIVYRRHTNFAMESIEQTFSGTANFGNKVSCLISRNGDLISGMYLQATLPDLQDKAVTEWDAGAGPAKRYTRWVDSVGHHLIKQVDLEIGGQLIDRHYGDWLEIWSQLTVPAGKRVGYQRMIGQDPLTALGQNTGLQADVYNSAGDANFGANTLFDFPASTTVIKGRELYVPLQFWFCRNIGLALPLIALQYHEVKVNIEFRQAHELVLLYTGDVAGATAEGNAWKTNSTDFNTYVEAGAFNLNASLWVDYIYLDTDERRRFAQVSHEYLIEQLQFTGDMSATTGSAGGTNDTSITLNFNHPVKELVWVVKGFENAKEWSNYTNTGLPSVPPFTTATSTDGVGMTGLPSSSGSGATIVTADGSVALTADVPTTPGSGYVAGTVYIVGLKTGTGILVHRATATVDGNGGIATLTRGGGDLGAGVYDAQTLQILSGEALYSYTPALPTNDAAVTLTAFATNSFSGISTLAHVKKFTNYSMTRPYGNTSTTALNLAANPVATAKLQLNGQDRFATRNGEYFNWVQCKEHHTNIPQSPGINVYSFALKPEDHQPSGTCNFSRIDNAKLNIALRTFYQDGTARAAFSATVRVYAVNYNVLRIMSGMGGLAYSN